MKVIFASTTGDLRSYTASACLEQVNNNILVSVAHLDSTNYIPENLTLTTLASLGILNHETNMTFLTQDEIDSSVVIAMDNQTRNKIQEQFGRLVPLFTEVSHNSSEGLKRLLEEESHHHVISTIHHIHEKTPNILKNLNNFYK